MPVDIPFLSFLLHSAALVDYFDGHVETLVCRLVQDSFGIGIWNDRCAVVVRLLCDYKSHTFGFTWYCGLVRLVDFYATSGYFAWLPLWPTSLYAARGFPRVLLGVAIRFVLYHLRNMNCVYAVSVEAGSHLIQEGP